MGGGFFAVLFRVMLGLGLAQDRGGMAALAVCVVFSVSWQRAAPVTGAWCVLPAREGTPRQHSCPHCHLTCQKKKADYDLHHLIHPPGSSVCRMLGLRRAEIGAWCWSQISLRSSSGGYGGRCPPGLEGQLDAASRLMQVD